MDIVSDFMRGMIKWKPFNSLLKESDIREIESEKLLVSKAVIMEDRISYINEVLVTAINDDLCVEVSFFSHGMLRKLSGQIERFSVIEKYILIGNTRIYFKNLINVNIL